MAAGKAHFSVAGIPVRIEPVFWIVTVFFAFNLSEVSLIVIWVGVVLVSILVHELGHAFALKAFGQPSSIVLHGFGGVTLSQRRLNRARSIVVSLAGSLTALALLGIPAYLLRESDLGFDIYLDWDGGFGLWPVLVFLVYVNIWWSIANLLPIRPLDGGNVMTELIGVQKARILSIVFGAGAAVWAWFFAEQGFRFAAFFAGFLAFINFAEYRREQQGMGGPSTFDIDAPGPGSVPPSSSSRRSRRTTRRPTRGGRPTGPPPASRQDVVAFPGGVDPASAESMAWNLLRRGDVPGARRVIQRATGPVGPFVGPTIACAAGDGVDDLVEAYVANPGGPSNLVPAGVAADAGQAVVLARALADRGRAGVEALGSLQTHLHYAERFEHAAAVGEVGFGAAGPTRAQVAFDAACSWSRAGDVDRAIDWVGRAIDAGFQAPGLLDGEPDLGPVRAHPAWPEVRSRA